MVAVARAVDVVAMLTADCRLQTADCRLQTADCKLQTADSRQQTRGKMQTEESEDCRPGVKCRLKTSGKTSRK